MASVNKKKKIAVKFLVDKENSRVVYSEAEMDFIDILFSFLTLPLGTIVRVLNKQSSLGCMDNLYESVENLDIRQLQTEACKAMLLHPRSEAALMCEDLEVSIDDTEPRVIYSCKNDDCCSKQTCLASSFQNFLCVHCKGRMDSVKTWPKTDAGAEKLFVKGGVKYIISDDLQVEPASTMHILSMIQKMDIKDYHVLEERVVDLGVDEILDLLKRSLVSRMPLTYFYYQKDMTDVVPEDGGDEKGKIQVKTERNEETNTEGVSIKLLVNKANNEVFTVEAGEDFINLVFSFLTLPLGSLIKIFNKNLAIGCVGNLYGSVEKLSLEYIQSEKCKSTLLSPKLGAFFGCSNSTLELDEIEPREGSVFGCNTCYWKNNNKGCTSKKCEHGVEKAVLRELNPKSPHGGIEKGGGYAKGPGKFLVADDLCVYPLSTSSSIKILSKMGPSLSNVVEREVKVGEVQVLELLRATLNTTTPLTDVFSPGQNLRKGSVRYSLYN